MVAAVRYRELLGIRALRSLFLAELVSGTGSWAFSTVYAFVLFDRTHSVAWITAGFAVRWGAALVFGPFAGVLSDRYDRARVMIASTGGSAALMAALAACVGVRAPLSVLLGLGLLEAAVAAAYGPAFGATLPDIVPERFLAAANGVREVIANVSIIAGPLLGTVFLVSGEPALGVALNSLSFIVPLVVVLRLGLHSRGSGEEGEGVFRELRGGFGALRAHPTTLVLLFAVAFDSGVASLSTTLAVPIAVRVGSGPDNYAYLLIALSLGSVVAAGIAARLAARARLAVVLIASLVLQAVPFALLVVLTTPVAAFVLLLASGVGMIIVDILAVTALQRDTPRQFLGRIFGILDTTVLAFVVVFSVVGGVVVADAGLSPVLLSVGIGVPVAVFAAAPALFAMDRRTVGRALELAPIVELLRRLDLFDGADQPALERLAEAAVRTELAAGASLITEGDVAEDLWLLEHGTLSVSARVVGALPDVAAPAYVGEIGLLHGLARTASVTTSSTCVLYRIPGRDFLDALSGGPASRSLTFVTGERISRTETVSQ